MSDGSMAAIERRLPVGFQDVLIKLCKAVLRSQPKDVLHFTANYFECRLDERILKEMQLQQGYGMEISPDLALRSPQHVTTCPIASGEVGIVLDERVDEDPEQVLLLYDPCIIDRNYEISDIDHSPFTFGQFRFVRAPSQKQKPATDGTTLTPVTPKENQSVMPDENLSMVSDDNRSVASDGSVAPDENRSLPPVGSVVADNNDATCDAQEDCVDQMLRGSQDTAEAKPISSQHSAGTESQGSKASTTNTDYIVKTEYRDVTAPARIFRQDWPQQSSGRHKYVYSIVRKEERYEIMDDTSNLHLLMKNMQAIKDGTSSISSSTSSSSGSSTTDSSIKNHHKK